MNQVLEDLRWKKFSVLSDGFVCLVDVMGDDLSIVQAARVSYGKDIREEGSPEGDSIRFVDKADEILIRYLMRHRHTTPFEMAELKFLVRVPMDCWRQWIRHRTANVNEYSTRYASAIDSMDVTQPDRWRLQSGSNKQGSEGFLKGGILGTIHRGDVLSDQESKFHASAKQLYELRLVDGVAREQARKDLPLSTYTEAYWKIDLHNLLHFLSLRMDSHAQEEIRKYATIIGEEIVKPLFPITWSAFEDYRLNSMSLSALDIGVFHLVFGHAPRTHLEVDGLVDDKSGEIWPAQWRGLNKCREREECIEKLRRITG